MDISSHNIQRITQWIQYKVITIFLILGIQLLSKMRKFYLNKVTKNLNKFALIAYLCEDIHCYLNTNTSYVFHVSENIEDIDLCLKSCFLVKLASNLAP